MTFRTPRRCHFLLVLAMAVAAVAASRPAAGAAYEDDPAVTRAIAALAPGESLLLPPVKHFKDGQPVNGEGSHGPYARDYTTRMAYAADRGTALYCGGNHNDGRTNAVWEFHLGSNAWHLIHPADGGDHARFKFALMFFPRQKDRDASEPNLKPDQRKQLEECRAWWRANVTARDGTYVMRETGAPLLPGHTWDTLIYDPVNRRLVQGFGAHCADDPAWLDHFYTGRPIDEARAAYGKRADGTPWRTPWTFDPATGRWSPYANASPLAELQGMGGSLLYIDDLRKAVWYYSGQNTPGAPHTMRLWDLEKDTWEELKPNDGAKIGDLGIRLKLAPECEQQMAYATPHKRIIAVEARSTFAYDFVANKWSKLNDAVPFEAHDAQTVFAYDPAADACLLADPRNDRVAAYNVNADRWETVTPRGPGLPKPPYGVGKGYVDTARNVFVVQSAYTDRMWVYRHAAGAGR